MAAIPLTKRVSVKERARLYSSEMSKKTYDELHKHAVEIVENGQSVILDATFSHKQGRQRLTDELNPLNVDYCFVEIQASDETIKARLKSRKQQNNVVSDARLEDFDKLNEKYDPPDELPVNQLIKINSEQTVEKSLSQLYESLAIKNVDR